MNRISWSFILFTIFLQSCIEDDILFDTIDPELRITSSVDTLEINSTFQFESIYFDNIGREQVVDLDWSSTDESVITVSNTGLVTAVSIGSAIIQARYHEGAINLIDEQVVHVGESTTTTTDQLRGSIRTTSTYALQGDFTVDQINTNVVINIADNYRASTALPGLYAYLSNNENSINGALEIGRVSTFSGEHQYIVENIGINDYRFLVYFCKPFNIKVGDGEIK